MRLNHKIKILSGCAINWHNIKNKIFLSEREDALKFNRMASSLMLITIAFVIFSIACVKNKQKEQSSESNISHLEIKSNHPAKNEKNVHINTIISVSFSEDMDVSTINASTFTVSNTTTGTISYSNKTASFTPDKELEYNSKYKVTITTGVKDIKGNAILKDYIWEFTTELYSDLIPPTVTSVNPLKDISEVPINTTISAVFSEEMNAASINSNSFFIEDGVASTVKYDNLTKTATLTPTSNLSYETTYTVVINTGVRDLAGNPLFSDCIWQFTTELYKDKTPPEIVSTSPASNATGVLISSSIIAVFSEKLDELSINSNTFTLSNGVEGVVSYDTSTKIAAFKPSANLKYNTKYSATITAGIKDINGNAALTDSTWQFTTELAPLPDTTRPTIINVSPINGALDIAANTLITATFSEGLDESTINTNTFTLNNGAVGIVSYDAPTRTAKFTISSNFLYFTTYIATLSTGIKDKAGNSLLEDYKWEFTTIFEPDTIPPTIISKTPADKAANVKINPAILFIFSEKIDAATINSNIFTINNGVTGTLVYDPAVKKATFFPDGDLSYGTNYTITINTTGIKDLAGNSMIGGNYIWEFTTETEPDTTPPVIISVDPMNNATGVPVNTVITVRFSEELNETSISNAISLNNNAVGIISYDALNKAINFTPTADLAYETPYTAAVNAGIKDKSGNALSANYQWVFTTGIKPDTTPPEIIFMNPYNNQRSVPVNTKIIVTFDEDLDTTTININSFYINSVAGNVTYSGMRTIIFTPANSLELNTIYTVKITKDLKNKRGISLPDEYSWNFTTPPSAIIAIDGGADHSMVIKSNGTIWSYGRNNNGQLGNNSQTDYFIPPVQVQNISNVIDIAGGKEHSIAITSDGNAYAWGVSNYYQIGFESTELLPKKISSFSNVASTASGANHSIFLKKDGTVWSCGLNSSGQLGDSTITNRITPVQAKRLTNIIDIAGGEEHTLALKNDGTVWAWGYNWDGQLGDGTQSNPIRIPKQIISLTKIVAIASGDDHNIVIKNDGTILTWGKNFSGQLGNGTYSPGVYTPTMVDGLTDVIAAAAGKEHSVILKNDGTVWAWGLNSSGQLGSETWDNSSIPVKVSGLSNVVAITSGANFSTALKNDSTVWAWGANDFGQLGDLTFNNSNIPVKAKGLSFFTRGTSISGGNMHSIAIANDSTVWTWGNNNAGQLGDGTVNNSMLPIAAVNGLTGIVDAAGGIEHSIALTKDGIVWAWGANLYGQLGDVSNIGSPTPIQSYITDVNAIACGSYHTVALKNDSTVWTWGANVYGQLGDNTTNSSNTPVQVGLTKIIKIAGGETHTLALMNDSTVWAWGLNDKGQLGNGTTDPSSIPVKVSDLTNIIAIKAGIKHSLALKNDGTVWAWGSNYAGQLGDGVVINSNPNPNPVQVNGLISISAIAAGGYHNIALSNSGTVWAWGENWAGQLGNNDSVPKSTPVQASGLTNIIKISAGSDYSLAIKNDNTVWTWGYNNNGQLGNGTLSGSTIPVQVRE